MRKEGQNALAIGLAAGLEDVAVAGVGHDE
jgi:hypothetical protein